MIMLEQLMVAAAAEDREVAVWTTADSEVVFGWMDQVRGVEYNELWYCALVWLSMTQLEDAEKVKALSAIPLADRRAEHADVEQIVEVWLCEPRTKWEPDTVRACLIRGMTWSDAARSVRRPVVCVVERFHFHESSSASAVRATADGGGPTTANRPRGCGDAAIAVGIARGHSTTRITRFRPRAVHNECHRCVVHQLGRGGRTAGMFVKSLTWKGLDDRQARL
jgi:hypothetical protein